MENFSTEDLNLIIKAAKKELENRNPKFKYFYQIIDKNTKELCVIIPAPKTKKNDKEYINKALQFFEIKECIVNRVKMKVNNLVPDVLFNSNI